MEIDHERIENAIIKEVAENIISDDTLWDRAKIAFDARVEKLWKEVAEARIRAEIETAIANGFDREYRRINSFGQPEGDKTSIRKELEKQINGYWNTTVDKRGRPSTGYGDKLTRAEWMMAQLCAADFQGEMKQHVVNVGSGLKDALRGELRATLDRLLGEVFHVRSADDQAEGRTK